MGGKCRKGSRVHASAAQDVSIGIEGHIPLSSGATIFPDHFIVHFVISNIVGFDIPIEFVKNKRLLYTPKIYILDNTYKHQRPLRDR